MELLVLGTLAFALFALMFVVFFKKPAGLSSIANNLVVLEKGQERLVQLFQDECQRLESRLNGQFSSQRTEIAQGLSGIRQEVRDVLKESSDSLSKGFSALKDDINRLTDTNEMRFELLRKTLERKMEDLQKANDEKLEKMRQTVDEKLQSTLEKRLGESFLQVSTNLEKVQKSLGEMQALAAGVGDLKKVLTNVKSRGTWGEIQLGNLLEDMLSPDQFSQNVQIRPRSAERVEFAIKLPGKDDDSELPVWLPIDAKFPREDYERLILAQENADPLAAAAAGQQLEATIKKSARDIRDKYIHPPHSTDFGILFLPIESLFAEVLRRPGLLDSLQQEFRITVAGPTTLCALLNSLQMGFRTLAVQKRSSEVWKILGAVKTEFGNFGNILEQVSKKLTTAQTTLKRAASKSNNISKKLKNIEETPVEGHTSLTMRGSSQGGSQEVLPASSTA